MTPPTNPVCTCSAGSDGCPIHGAEAWIEHNGGPCPVPGETVVEVKYRGFPDNLIDAAKWYRWDHKQGAGDIIAYRPVPAPTPAQPDADDREWAREVAMSLPGSARVNDIVHILLSAIARERARASTTAPTPGQAVAGGETPETDAEAERLRRTGGYGGLVSIPFARSLERRLSASTTALDELREENRRLRDAGANMSDYLRFCVPCDGTCLPTCGRCLLLKTYETALQTPTKP